MNPIFPFGEEGARPSFSLNDFWPIKARPIPPAPELERDFRSTSSSLSLPSAASWQVPAKQSICLRCARVI